MTSCLKNVHLANIQLEIERMKLSTRPKTIKTFSGTCWNGTALIYLSVLEFRVTIANVFNNEITKPETEESLLDIAGKI